MKIEIDQGSGFCFGVTRAINKAEEELARGATLYCLGDIVHNGKECDRLKNSASSPSTTPRSRPCTTPKCSCVPTVSLRPRTGKPKPTGLKS